MRKQTKKVFLVLSLILIFLILLLFTIRLLSHREIDDVSPGIYCESEYLEKADILWVIPDYDNSDISKNIEWCKKIINLNKEVQMHGVKHQPYKEFEVENRSQEYFQEGINIFEICFNQTPAKFKAPQLAFSSENKKMIKKNFPNIKIKHYFNQIIHKVYHCSDTGLIKNNFTDKF